MFLHLFANYWHARCIQFLKIHNKYVASLSFPVNFIPFSIHFTNTFQIVVYILIGYFLHFQVVPVWDVFVPAVPPADGNPGTPATETMYVGNYGVAWGFRVVPEPSSIVIMTFGMVTLVGVAWKRKK